MRKATILLAVICSIFVGASMALTLHILNGGGSASAGQGKAAADGHNMPPGMSHEEHLKQMAAKQQSGGQEASTADKPGDQSVPAGMDHNMPAGMSHEEHQKMMAAAAAKQQSAGQQGSTGDKPMDHSSTPAGMDHNMPAGMSHEEHMKMMAAGAAQSHAHHPGQDDSPDPRPEFRAIKSLTAEEIQAYQEGTGHGMAKAAEQNHYPGPRHILDLSKELQLSAEQIREIESIKASMSTAAIATGKQLIENERKLNLLFAEKKIDQTQLASVVAESASLQGKLRVIHLSAHLKAEKLLSKAQIDKYDELRGYKNAKNPGADAHHDHSM